MEVSETTVKFSSSQFEVAEPMEIGETVVFQGQGEIVKVEHLNKQDGTMKQVFIVKPEIAVVRAALEPYEPTLNS